MKRPLLLAIALALALSLAACGGESASTAPTEPPVTRAPAPAPDESAAPEQTEAPASTLPPEQTEAPPSTLPPDETQPPENTHVPDEAQPPEETSPPAPTPSPEPTPENTENPEATETPAPADAPETTPTPAPALPEAAGYTIPEFSVTINGVTVDQNTLASCKLYSVSVDTVNTYGTASTTSYVGFVMREVLAAVGLTDSYAWLQATADDGYSMTYGGVMGDYLLLAVYKNGEACFAGPWIAPCASAVTGDYLKRCVTISVG